MLFPMKFWAATICWLLLASVSPVAGQISTAPKEASDTATAEKLPNNSTLAELQLKDLSGTRHSLSDYRGKFVVLNFWATWCAPCQNEMPMLAKANKKYGSQSLVVIAASIDESSTLQYVPKFIQNENMDMPVWIGATLADMEKLEVGPGLPSTVFIDKDGKIISRIIGQLKKNDLQPRNQWMLGARTRTPPPALADNMKKKK